MRKLFVVASLAAVSIAAPAMAQDAGNSTFYAAIHTMFDVSQGLAPGDQVAQQVVKRAQTDGAQ